jgi:hypothetical protein
MSRTLRWASLLLSACAATHAHAAARAWLQPDRIALGDVTTLNIETDENAAPPDFSELRAQFELRGQSSSVQSSIGPSGRSTRTLYAVALEPRTAGELIVPALRVGDATTEPLKLTVTPAVAASAERGDAIYLETELGSSEPYVQQPVPYTVRLYYAVPLSNGTVDARAPDGASLQQVGEDKNYTQSIGGRRYNVFERNFLLLPERSGALELPAPVFRGRAPSNDVDAFFDRGRAVSAVGEGRRLNVRAQPADAPSPWLPAHGLRLQREALPSTARAGEPLMLELTLQADGTTAAQLPELTLPAIDGAQVFPEAPRTAEVLTGERPHASVTRRFAIVPAQARELTIPSLRIGYWNTADDRADAAELPAQTLTIEPGMVGRETPVTIVPAAPTVTATPASAVGADPASLRAWQLVAAATTLGMLAALAWGWRRGRTPLAAPAPCARHDAEVAPRIRRALAEGDLQAIGAALLASCTPRATSLAAFAERLADPSQRAAVRELERALWAAGVDRGEREATRDRLRAAFRDGPRFERPAAMQAETELPPLYPRR